MNKKKIIDVNNLSVRYVVGDFKEIGIKEYIVRRLTGKYSVSEFFAIKNVSFSLYSGDMLGIIGSNGSGKSTLLKAVSGIMRPTFGSISLHGSVSALLELGSGFDGDLTVRENVYLRGAMLGYTREFMDRVYEDIISFAELSEVEHRAFKHLSSGMKARLAFSVAVRKSPNLLILDEVLSVGDGAFKQKSEERMRSIIRGGSTTILVSHSLSQIRSISNKILWLDKGKAVAFSEDVDAVCRDYEKFLQGAKQ